VDVRKEGRHLAGFLDRWNKGEDTPILHSPSVEIENYGMVIIMMSDI